MSEHVPPVNRIPHESIVNEDVSSWTLPAMKGAIISETANIKDKAGVHIRGRSQHSSAGVKESIEVVSAEAKPKSLTADDLKQIEADAHKEGYSEGYAEGLRKGTEKGLEKGTQQGKDQAYKETKSEMIDLQNRLRDISKNLLSPMNEQDQVLENTIVDMAFFFAQSLLEAEVSQSPSKLYSIVNKALSTMPVGAGNILVRLNSNDAELLENILPKMDRPWNIQRDDSLKSGGCIVQSKESLVDYSVETRIEKFMAELENSEATGMLAVQEVRDWRKDIPEGDDKINSINKTSDNVNNLNLDEESLDPSHEDNSDIPTKDISAASAVQQEKEALKETLNQTLNQDGKSNVKTTLKPSKDAFDGSPNESESDS